jgi:hypothetical protein
VLVGGCDQEVAPAGDASADDGGADASWDGAYDGCSGELSEVSPAAQAVLYHEDEEFWLVEAVVDGNLTYPPVDIVQLEIWPGRGGPVEPGEYVIERAGYAGCGLCVLLRRSCRPEDGIARCERDLLAHEGTVEIDELETPGGAFSASLRDVVLVETVIDWDGGTFESEPVGPEVVCLDALDLESTVTSYPAR